MKQRFVILFLAGLALGLMVPAEVLGQTNDAAIKPINVDKLPASRPIVEYALAGGFLIGALAIAFKPSKRTPQD